MIVLEGIYYLAHTAIIQLISPRQAQFTAFGGYKCGSEDVCRLAWQLFKKA
jgi:hypothetical protein